jgi:hypothetical protein
MKEQFKDINITPNRMQMVNLCNQIIDIYQKQNLRLTLRQLYYQLVTRNAIRNEERSYKIIGKLVSDARLAGLIDWDAIEDRVRVPRIPTEFNNLKELVDTAINSYRLPRWEGQEYYIELWVEKDALSGVLAPLARKYHVTLMVNRGYSSSSAMYESAQRFAQHADQNRILFYLGDHDPSGEDMVRDIQERLTMFLVEVKVTKIALTFDQVKRYNPPPNPTKITDTRSARYIDKYGEECWEVDALPPDTLHSLIEASITRYIDVHKMGTIIEKENADKEYLKSTVAEIK